MQPSRSLIHRLNRYSRSSGLTNNQLALLIGMQPTNLKNLSHVSYWDKRTHEKLVRFLNKAEGRQPMDEASRRKFYQFAYWIMWCLFWFVLLTS